MYSKILSEVATTPCVGLFEFSKILSVASTTPWAGLFDNVLHDSVCCINNYMGRIV